MHVAGLTGGTGAGKSSAARRFETHGISIIDADRIGHALAAPGGDAVDVIVNAFGDAILSCGKISREKLGALVFADATALAMLNEIMQPRIALTIAQRCAELAASGCPVCIIDAALLGDDGTLEPCLESLILVCSPEESRVARLVTHRDMTRELAWKRIRAQVDPETKRAFSRWVIENDGTLDDLHKQVDVVADALLSDGGSSSHGTV